MLWYIISTGVPEGTQVLAVQAPSKSVAIRYAKDEVKDKYNLPSSYTVMPRILNTVETEKDARWYIDKLHELIEEEG